MKRRPPRLVDEDVPIPGPTPAAPSPSYHRLPGRARGLWTAAGVIFLILGALGIPLPLLPTTPFLLLAAACFLRGSPRLYTWTMTNRYFGAYLRDYRAGRGIPATTKLLAISLLWLGIGLSAWLVVRTTLLRLALLCIAVVVTVHIVLIRTKRPPPVDPPSR